MWKYSGILRYDHNKSNKGSWKKYTYNKAEEEEKTKQLMQITSIGDERLSEVRHCLKSRWCEVYG